MSSALETHSNVFVSYYDVSKAFDTVWINGLFYKLYIIGIKGKILYRTYVDFWCKVRIQGSTSEWYQMRCGIHQGGFLSLIKYIAFINDLICQLEDSGLCCDVAGIASTPPGYADDIATACIDKSRMDRVMDRVDMYGKKWRFKFNAKKSAVLIYGEGQKKNTENSQYRVFKLGNDRVLERQSYDHVGVKACLYSTDESRVKEKNIKGRRALNACAGIGIRKNGLTMNTCSIIFWSIVIPIITFGAEMWILSEKDLENLNTF